MSNGPLLDSGLTQPKRAGSYVIDWGVELDAQTKAWEKENQFSTTAAPAKRAATGIAELPDRGSKKIKTADADDGMSDEAMKKAFDKNEIGKVSRFSRFCREFHRRRHDTCG